MEIRNNDQYVVKVSGSGRLTLRNRRFLRLYTLHSLTAHPHLRPSAPQSAPPHITDYVPLYNAGTPALATKSTPRSVISQPPLPSSSTPTPSVTPPRLTPCPSSRTRASCTPQYGDQVNLPRIGRREAPQRLVFGDVEEDVEKDLPRSPVQFETRPPRQRQQRLIYDASSGQYNPPSATPDDI